MFGNDFPNALLQQQMMNQQYLSQLNQMGLGQISQGNTQPIAPTNPNDRLIVLLTEV